MKKRYSEEQIIRAIRHEAGAKVGDLSSAHFIGYVYNWRSKYAGMEVNERSAFETRI